jgi:hypothetical protein
MDRVLALSNRLRKDGIDCHIDRDEESPSKGWPQWCADQVEEADFVLVACTETYRRRFEGKEGAATGLGGTWEGHIIMQELYNAQGKNTKFIPIIFSQHDASYVPVILQGATCYELGDVAGYERLHGRLTKKPMPPVEDQGEFPGITECARTIYQPLYDDLGNLERAMNVLGTINGDGSMQAIFTPDEIHYVELAAEPVGKARTGISQFDDADTRQRLDAICNAINVIKTLGQHTEYGKGARALSSLMVKSVTELREMLRRRGCK